MGGTGQKFATATIIIAGGASLAATIFSAVSVWLQTKNYRKPLLQRYVVRILIMVPIYSFSSWLSMISLRAAAFGDPIRDIYEAFTIYTFFQLLINYLRGERALIIMTHGRVPVDHLWPLNHILPPVDISDPHTFLAIKRGILQYAWLKPILSFAAIIMKATGTYQEGYLGLESGYFWSGLIYNSSVSLSLYALGLFWVCMHDDLKPFRPVPKFLCVKLIIFASYWQGFFLSILVWIGALPDDVQGYTPDNLAAAIQDFLICVEMPAFAIAHWYAFSWRDFADNGIASARMPMWYAWRDAFGVRDLIEDSKETFSGDKYGYRVFDSGDKIMAHESSRSRLARLKDGMRYERGGKGKYWIPKPDEINQATPLLGAPNEGPSTRSECQSPHLNDLDELILDPDEEILYNKARKLEFGDWNYPVVTTNETSHHERFLSSPPPRSNQISSNGHSSLPDPIKPLERRKKSASKGTHNPKDKGKSKAHSNPSSRGPSPKQRDEDQGKDPLEIAYGPIVGTKPTITADDFRVEDTKGAMHRPQDHGEHHDGRPPSVHADDEGPVKDESGHWARPSAGRGAGSLAERGSTYCTSLGGADEFRNDVWGK